MTNVDEMTNVMAAYANGEHIEFRLADVDTTESDWAYVSTPTWNWHKYEYRIAPSRKAIKMFMTNCQLGELIQKGYGTWNLKDAVDHYAYAEYSFDLDRKDEQAFDKMIRPWGSDKWIEPTVDIYDCYVSQWNKAFGVGVSKTESTTESKKSLCNESFCDVKDYSYARPSSIEPFVNERFLYKGKIYRCVPSDECAECAFNNEERLASRDCSIFRCYRSNRKDENSVKFVEE